MSVSAHSIDSVRSRGELIKGEALHICCTYVWSSFLCVLALSTVCSRRIQCYYRTFGSCLKYRLMFSQSINSRNINKSTETVHLLFCYEGDNLPDPFKHNHFVPLVFCSTRSKSVCVFSVPYL